MIILVMLSNQPSGGTQKTAAAGEGASPRSFDLGGTDSNWVGRILVSQSHLPPNSDFSSDFAHFHSEIPENPNFSVNIQKIFLKNRDLWGDIPPGILDRGDMSPASPPVATPMCITTKDDITGQ